MPFIVRPPVGQIQGGRREAGNLVNANLDFFPTVFDKAGVPSPVGLEGKSVHPLVEEHASSHGHPFVVSQNDLAPIVGQSGGVLGRMIRSARFKYGRFSEGANPEQLFKLDLDLGEMNDLKKDPDHLQVLVEHCRMLNGLDGGSRRSVSRHLRASWRPADRAISLGLTDQASDGFLFRPDRGRPRRDDLF